MTWHVDTGTLEAYVDGALDPAGRWSVETHVTGCLACRQGVVAATAVSVVDGGHRLEAIWSYVVDEIDAGRQKSLIERVLNSAGVPEHLARLLATTPSLTLSWLLGVAATLAVAVAAAWATGPGSAPSDPTLFLILAPLLPLAGVAVSYGPGVDPTHDVALAAPLPSGRLLLLRSLAVLTSTIPLALVAGLALPRLDWTVVAWILPALALSGAALALSTRMNPLAAGGLLGALWVVGTVAAVQLSQQPLMPFGASAQLVAAVVAAVSALYVVREQGRFESKDGR